MQQASFYLMQMVSRDQDGAASALFAIMLAVLMELAALSTDDPTVSIDVRERCVRSCESLFGQLFGSRCSAHLSLRDEPGSAPLNAVCYMWWDTMPVSGGPNPDDRVVLHRTALETMAAVLEMNSLACQESALHGLGHWRSGFPGKVEALLLTRSSKLTLTLAPSYWLTLGQLAAAAFSELVALLGDVERASPHLEAHAGRETWNYTALRRKANRQARADVVVTGDDRGLLDQSLLGGAMGKA